MQPFEDVFPIKHGDLIVISMSSQFSGVSVCLPGVSVCLPGERMSPAELPFCLGASSQPVVWQAPELGIEFKWFSYERF